MRAGLFCPLTGSYNNSVWINVNESSFENKAVSGEKHRSKLLNDWSGRDVRCMVDAETSNPSHSFTQPLFSKVRSRPNCSHVQIFIKLATDLVLERACPEERPKSEKIGLL